MVGLVLGGGGKGGVILPALSNPAAPGNVLKDKDYINAANERGVGTIISKAAQTYTPGTSAQIIAAGQYLSGAQTINPIPNIYRKYRAEMAVFAESVNTMLEIATPFAVDIFHLVFVFSTLPTYVGSGYTALSLMANRGMETGIIFTVSSSGKAMTLSNAYYYGQIVFGSDKITINLAKEDDNIYFSKGIYQCTYAE